MQKIYGILIAAACLLGACQEKEMSVFRTGDGGLDLTGTTADMETEIPVILAK